MTVDDGRRAATNPVADLLGEADAAFAAGDVDRFAALFTDDACLYLLHREAAEGRAAIRELWRSFFARFDTSAWEPRTEVIEVHGSRAYAFGTYEERLRTREDGSRWLVRGRLIPFLRCDEDGTWRIWLLMNSHARPMERLS